MGMDTRYGGTKITPRERIDAIYRVDPRNRSEAMESHNRVDWEHAADSESESLEANDTWEMAVRTDDMHPLHTKWFLKVKTNAEGNVEQ